MNECPHGLHNPALRVMLLHTRVNNEVAVLVILDVSVQIPPLSELQGSLEHFFRVRFEDKLLPQSKGGVVILTFQARWDIAFPQMKILLRMLSERLVGPL